MDDIGSPFWVVWALFLTLFSRPQQTQIILLHCAPEPRPSWPPPGEGGNWEGSDTSARPQIAVLGDIRGRGSWAGLARVAGWAELAASQVRFNFRYENMCLFAKVSLTCTFY